MILQKKVMVWFSIFWLFVCFERIPACDDFSKQLISERLCRGLRYAKEQNADEVFVEWLKLQRSYLQPGSVIALKMIGHDMVDNDGFGSLQDIAIIRLMESCRDEYRKDNQIVMGVPQQRFVRCACEDLQKFANVPMMLLWNCLSRRYFSDQHCIEVNYSDGFKGLLWRPNSVQYSSKDPDFLLWAYKEEFDQELFNRFAVPDYKCED